jgi:hypothetical protein
MSRPIGPRRGLLGLLVLAILVALVALPTFAAEPSASPAATAEPTATAGPTATAEPTATAAPTATATAAPTATPEPTATAAPRATVEPEPAAESPKPEKSPKPPKAEKAPATDVTISGTVGTRTDADGRTEYTMTAGGRTLVLDGGPSWFYGDDHPLRPYVGERVTITGSQRAGEDEVDVDAVDGTRLRAAGKPPWAGGWKRVGARHPGWTQEKADRWQARRDAKAQALGLDCFPPGQCKVKPGDRGAASDDMTGADAGG